MSLSGNMIQFRMLFLFGAVFTIFLIGGILPVSAAPGDVKSTIEINDLTLNGPELANGDWFGSSVASIGDMDGDGINDIAVGAKYDDAGGTLHIIFLNPDGTPKSTIEINDRTASGPELSDGDYFGSSVASMGDLDGDGITDIAVGAGRDDASGTNQGAMHIIFLNPDGTPKSTIEINDRTASGPELSDGDYFGSSVANIGDLNGDGIADMAVGAFQSDAGDTDKGAIHIIFLDGVPVRG